MGNQVTLNNQIWTVSKDEIDREYLQGRHDVPRNGTPPQSHRVEAFLESGQIANQADIARREGISRARVTQVMGMLRLAPEIQEQILSLPENIRRPPATERMLRPIEPITDHRDQRLEFRKLSAV